MSIKLHPLTVMCVLCATGMKYPIYCIMSFVTRKFFADTRFYYGRDTPKSQDTSRSSSILTTTLSVARGQADYTIKGTPLH